VKILLQEMSYNCALMTVHLISVTWGILSRLLTKYLQLNDSEVYHLAVFHLCPTHSIHAV
jgi:hypothetical protein